MCVCVCVESINSSSYQQPTKSVKYNNNNNNTNTNTNKNSSSSSPHQQSTIPEDSIRFKTTAAKPPTGQSPPDFPLLLLLLHPTNNHPDSIRPTIPPLPPPTKTNRMRPYLINHPPVALLLGDGPEDAALRPGKAGFGARPPPGVVGREGLELVCEGVCVCVWGGGGGERDSVFVGVCVCV